MKFGNLYKLLHLYKADNQQIRNNKHLVGWKPLECLLRRRLVFSCSVLKPCYLKNVFMLLFLLTIFFINGSLWQQKSAGNLSALGTLWLTLLELLLRQFYIHLFSSHRWNFPIQKNAENKLSTVRTIPIVAHKTICEKDRTVIFENSVKA